MQLTNQKMNNLLKKINNSNYIDKSLKISLQNVQEIMWPKFYKKNGCIFINKSSLFNQFQTDNDLSKIEADENEFPINGYLEIKKNTPKLEIVKFGLMLVEMWGCKLKNEFPDSKFHIIFSFSERYGNLRFYKIRDNDFGNLICLDLDNLDSYANAIIVRKF